MEKAEGGHSMPHKVKLLVPVEKRTLFGKKTVMQERTVTVDGKTYRKMKQAERDRPYSIEEMMFCDFMFGED